MDLHLQHITQVSLTLLDVIPTSLRDIPVQSNTSMQFVIRVFSWAMRRNGPLLNFSASHNIRLPANIVCLLKFDQGLSRHELFRLCGLTVTGRRVHSLLVQSQISVQFWRILVRRHHINSGAQLRRNKTWAVVAWLLKPFSPDSLYERVTFSSC